MEGDHGYELGSEVYAFVFLGNKDVLRECGVNLGMRSRLLVLLAGFVTVSAMGEKRDYRSQAFRVAVALGESTTAGGTATTPELSWVSLLADLINESQVEPVRMINNGIGANLISPRSPTYQTSEHPSALERYREHVIVYDPDLVLVSYGFNDARGGTPLGQFLDDLRHIVMDIKKQTGAVVVMVNSYFLTGFEDHAPYDRANVAVLQGYNSAMKQLAAECDVLLADVFAAEDQAPWMIDTDGVHPNNLGHRVIANRIFEVLAQNCSALSGKAFQQRKSMKQWRPAREKQIQKEYYEKRKKE